MRIEVSLHHDDPAAATLRAIPSGERAAGLRALLRLHAREIPALLGLTPVAAAMAPAAASPPAAPVLRAGVTPGSASAASPKTPPADRAAMARRLVKLGAACTKVLAGFAVVSAFALGLPHAAHAAEPSTVSPWTLDLNVASVHTEAWARQHLNQRNPGIGATYHYSRTWALAGGVYRGSYRRPVYYAQAEYTPLHLGSVAGWHADAGVMAGVATYTRREVACAPFAAAALLRITAPDGIGADIVAVPNQSARQTGFIGLQISIPLH